MAGLMSTNILFLKMYRGDGVNKLRFGDSGVIAESNITQIFSLTIGSKVTVHQVVIVT